MFSAMKLTNFEKKFTIIYFSHPLSLMFLYISLVLILQGIKQRLFTILDTLDCKTVLL